jgi:hypothetical protein
MQAGRIHVGSRFWNRDTQHAKLLQGDCSTAVACCYIYTLILIEISGYSARITRDDESGMLRPVDCLRSDNDSENLIVSNGGDYRVAGCRSEVPVVRINIGMSQYRYPRK